MKHLTKQEAIGRMMLALTTIIEERHLDTNYRIIMNLRRAGVSPAKRATL